MHIVLTKFRVLTSKTIKMLYEEKLQAKDELLHERFLRNTELKEQVAELKKEIAELRKHAK